MQRCQLQIVDNVAFVDDFLTNKTLNGIFYRVNPELKILQVINSASMREQGRNRQ